VRPRIDPSIEPLREGIALVLRPAQLATDRCQPAGNRRDPLGVGKPEDRLHRLTSTVKIVSQYERSRKVDPSSIDRRPGPLHGWKRLIRIKRVAQRALGRNAIPEMQPRRPSTSRRPRIIEPELTADLVL